MVNISFWTISNDTHLSEIKTTVRTILRDFEPILSEANTTSSTILSTFEPILRDIRFATNTINSTTQLISTRTDLINKEIQITNDKLDNLDTLIGITNNYLASISNNVSSTNIKIDKMNDTLSDILTAINNISFSPRYVQNAGLYKFYSTDENRYLFTNEIANYRPDTNTEYGVFYFTSGYAFIIPTDQLYLVPPSGRFYDVIFPNGQVFIVNGYFETGTTKLKPFKALHNYLQACRISH